MAQSINKVIIIGNLGKDPELRYTPSGKPVTTLSVATSTRSKNRQTGEWEDTTQWHRVTVLGDAAEWAGQKLTKGRTVYVDGSLKYGSYTNKDGARIPTVEIATFQVEPFGAKKGAGQEGFD
ncbi:MAG: single-stranded DNA-binding protein, partial [Burkholderiales bacterium PBB4]